MTEVPAEPTLSAAPAGRVLWGIVGFLAVALVLGLGTYGFQRLHRSALAELTRQGESTLGLAVAALDGQLRRYDRLPGLLAQQDVVRDLLYYPSDPGRVRAANLYLRATAQLLQASDIYVMNLAGLTLAASNFDRPLSFVGGNFSFRPYFQDALTQGRGRFYALGTTSQVRGYYFAAPVLIDDSMAGVLVIKIDLDAIEQGWRGSGTEVLVTDPEDIVFMSTNPDWTFAATRPSC